MAEARHRKQQREKEQYEQAAGQVFRSPAIEPGPIEIPSSPGLVDVLNQLVGAGAPDPQLMQAAEEAFDLQRYEQHVIAVLNRLPDGDEVTLQWIPSLVSDDRLERIRLFIALIFLAHAGLIDLRQGNDNTIWVSQRETQRERSTVSADAQAADA